MRQKSEKEISCPNKTKGQGVKEKNFFFFSPFKPSSTNNYMIKPYSLQSINQAQPKPGGIYFLSIALCSTLLSGFYHILMPF